MHDREALKMDGHHDLEEDGNVSGQIPPRTGRGELNTRPSQDEAEEAVRTLIRWAGDDVTREGLLDTPARVARSYIELFAGYETDPRGYLERTFEEVGGYDQLIVLRDIRFVSFCEHHMLPVIGKAHVGYLPNGRVVGISKLARVVNGFARRLQGVRQLDGDDGHALLDAAVVAQAARENSHLIEVQAPEFGRRGAGAVVVEQAVGCVDADDELGFEFAHLRIEVTRFGL